MDCKTIWCDSSPKVMGYCNRHYLQVRRHGKTFKTGHDKREAVLDGDTAKLPLTRGMVAIIDVTDLETTNAYQWYFDGKYASTNLLNEGKMRLHTLLMQPKDGVVDHINRDKLDNRRSNLRKCSVGDNNHNQEDKNPHGLRGITWNKRKQKWVAQISINNKNKGLGYFQSKIEAAKAYNERAIEIYGEFANLNTIKEA